MNLGLNSPSLSLTSASLSVVFKLVQSLETQSRLELEMSEKLLLLMARE